MNSATPAPSYEMICHHAEQVMQFLNRIGLRVSVEPGANGFIPHVAVVDGGLHVDRAAPASGLLHEAGHLALVPTQFRHYLSGDLDAGVKRIFSELDSLNLGPDSKLERAMLQASDPEATAWAWAAGKAIGIPERMIIQDFEYSGSGGFIRSALAANSYVGINGMSHAGFCIPRKRPNQVEPVYPELAFWLQH